MPAPLFLLGMWPALGITEVAAALLVLAFVLLWIVSSAGNLEKVLAWLTAGRRAREAKVNERLDKLEAKTSEFVGEETLDKQFNDIRDRHRKLVETVRALQGAQHDLAAQQETIKGDVRRNQEGITQLTTLNPRVTKTESDILLLLQQMQQLKEGQNEIKDRLNDVATAGHNDRDAILNAIRNLKS